MSPQPLAPFDLWRSALSDIEGRRPCAMSTSISMAKVFSEGRVDLAENPKKYDWICFCQPIWGVSRYFLAFCGFVRLSFMKRKKGIKSCEKLDDYAKMNAVQQDVQFKDIHCAVAWQVRPFSRRIYLEAWFIALSHQFVFLVKGLRSKASFQRARKEKSERHQNMICCSLNFSRS